VNEPHRRAKQVNFDWPEPRLNAEQRDRRWKIRQLRERRKREEQNTYPPSNAKEEQQG
jgi:hypothetical protein